MQITRNRVESDQFILTRLKNQEDFLELTKLFDCGDEDLNQFFKIDAHNHQVELLTQTYNLQAKAIEGKITPPVAFVSFANDNIRISEQDKDGKLKKLWEHMRENIPEPKLQYLSYPAVKIARLGVKRDYQRLNIGTFLLNMVKELFLTDNRTGCRFLTVDAYKKEEVVNFYKKNGFEFLWKKDENKKMRIMYFDLKSFQLSPLIR